MKNLSNKNTEIISSIVNGLFYLSQEAENGDLKVVRNLLLTTIDDIVGWVDNASEDNNESASYSIIKNSSFIAAIEFLSKFASIKDSKLKKEILDEIGKIECVKADNVRPFPIKKR